MLEESGELVVVESCDVVHYDGEEAGKYEGERDLDDVVGDVVWQDSVVPGVVFLYEDFSFCRD